MLYILLMSRSAFPVFPNILLMSRSAFLFSQGIYGILLPNYQHSISAPVSVTRIWISHWAEGLPSAV